MGSGRDKRKKQAKRAGKESDAASGAAKTDRKTDKNAAKLERRVERANADDDIDAILASIKLMDAKQHEVVVRDDVPKPTPRCNCSFTATLTQKPAEIILFGGEVVDAAGKTRVFGDLYRYDAEKNRWRLVQSPNAPPPRSAHQAVAHGGYLYVFGGEFTSPNQERFHHYRDFWRLDLKENTWESLPNKTGPSARSGHRMVTHPNGRSILLFGGFYDTGAEIRYYNDVWELALETMTWKIRSGGSEGIAGAGVGKGGAGASTLQGPSPRSASHVSALGDAMYVYGGYCKYAGDGDGDDGDVEKGVTHADLWRLDLKSWSWERLKKQGLAPGPRAGATSAVHAAKRRSVLFGGVVDHEIRKGEVIVSEFFSDAYAMSLDGGRWFPVTLYAEKSDGGAGAGAGGGGGGGGIEGCSYGHTVRGGGGGGGGASTAARGKEEAERVARGEVVNENFNIRSDVTRAAVKIQAHYRGYAVRKAYKLYRVGGQVSELLYSPGSGDAAPKTAPRPRGRMNAAVAVRGNGLYMFGGAVEIGDAEVALDDVWVLELTARPRWRRVAEMSPEVMAAVAGDAVLSSDDEEEEEDEKRKKGTGGGRKKKDDGDDDDDDDDDDDGDDGDDD